MVLRQRESHARGGGHRHSAPVFEVFLSGSVEVQKA